MHLYSICEKYYNQVISTNHFYCYLLDNPTFKNKRLQSDISSNSPISTYDFNIHKEIDELYLETNYIKSCEHIITILQQQLQE